MKKSGILIFAFAAMILCACNSGGNNTSVISEVSVNNSVSEEKPAVVSQISQERESILYKLPYKEVYMDMPVYQQKEEAYTKLFLIPKEKYVSLTFDYENSAGTLKEAHDICFKMLQHNLDNFQGGVNEMNVSVEKECEISGYKMLRLEGTISYGTEDKYDGYSVAYVFTVDGNPCEIIGSVIEKNQSDRHRIGYR